MQWHILYDQGNKPSFEDINNYINSALWSELNTFLQQTYRVKPQLSYSRCSMQPGWNIKYKKGGKSLCTLYPMEGFFITLVVIGNKEKHEAELILPACSEYTRELYLNTDSSIGGRWLMLHVRSAPALEDALKLIDLRIP